MRMLDFTHFKSFLKYPVRRSVRRTLLLLAGLAVSVQCAHTIPHNPVRGTEDSRPRLSGEKPEQEPESEPPRELTGQEIFEAFGEAYPDRIEETGYRNGDWALRIDGKWFYWAEGRLLPEEIRTDWRNYSRHPFYRYPKELPPLRVLSGEKKKELKARLESREANPPTRHPGLFNALWELHDRETSWNKVKTTYFLGLKTQIHRNLLEDLADVEEAIYTAARTSSEVRRFIDSLAQLEGYSWRRISGTASLSFHSYGTALDLLPRSYGGKQVYWRWTLHHFEEWYAVPYEDRFSPPREVIEAFENHGFIWGGKWFYFDSIHFEYRPELLVLSGMR